MEWCTSLPTVAFRMRRTSDDTGARSWRIEATENKAIFGRKNCKRGKTNTWNQKSSLILHAEWKNCSSWKHKEELNVDFSFEWFSKHNLRKHVGFVSTSVLQTFRQSWPSSDKGPGTSDALATVAFIKVCCMYWVSHGFIAPAGSFHYKKCAKMISKLVSAGWTRRFQRKVECFWAKRFPGLLLKAAIPQWDSPFAHLGVFEEDPWPCQTQKILSVKLNQSRTFRESSSVQICKHRTMTNHSAIKNSKPITILLRHNTAITIDAQVCLSHEGHTLIVDKELPAALLEL